MPAATVGEAGYDAYLAVMPADALADIYIRYGSRLLEGNVRTFLGRRGNVNKGIATTLAKEPNRFFAYNNGIATTAVAVTTKKAKDGSLIVISASDLQIVNGAQTTASLAGLRRDPKTSLSGVFVPMKLSVVPQDVAEEIIPLISRYANSQNAVRASDFFANHPFHRRLEECSRRVLAPAVGSSQVSTHWYYERARGQYLNDQLGLTSAKRDSFLRINPKSQVITKTDLAKVESCFAGLPDIACKGAEKSFVDFAERITKAWQDDKSRSEFGDKWFKQAVAKVILFRACERLVSEAPWYEGGYRAQIVAYASARLATLAHSESNGGRLDYQRIWSAQSAGEILERQLVQVAEVMAGVLRAPPLAGQNISEWAKQPACRKNALETSVPTVKGLKNFLLGHEESRAERKNSQEAGRLDEQINAVTAVLAHGPQYWAEVKEYAQKMRLLSSEDDKAFYPALANKLPTDRQAERLMSIVERCEQAGWRSTV